MEDTDHKAEIPETGNTASSQEYEVPQLTPSDYYRMRHEEKQQRQTQQDPAQVKDSTPPTGDFVTRDEFVSAQKERHVAEYIRQNPELASYSEKVLKYWNHPTRKDLPVDSAFADAIGPKELMRLGAEQAKAEQEAAKRTIAGGGARVREQESSAPTKDVFSMTVEEFTKYKAERLRT